jgi:hypothetical protein
VVNMLLPATTCLGTAVPAAMLGYAGAGAARGTDTPMFAGPSPVAVSPITWAVHVVRPRVQKQVPGVHPRGRPV